MLEWEHRKRASKIVETGLFSVRILRMERDNIDFVPTSQQTTAKRMYLLWRPAKLLLGIVKGCDEEQSHPLMVRECLSKVGSNR